MFEYVRNEIGFEVELLHDIHERLQPIEAVGFAKDMEQFKLFFLYAGKFCCHSDS